MTYIVAHNKKLKLLPEPTETTGALTEMQVTGKDTELGESQDLGNWFYSMQIIFLKKVFKFVNFWLCWVFVVARAFL